ncbi:MAG TPA: ATP-binding protein [Fibrobacteria bacterium]|nr:ATP-binding protein [Fibrobacteria bacterium]
MIVASEREATSLWDHLEEIYARLTKSEDAPPFSDARNGTSASASGHRDPVEHLRELFSLSDFERDVLLLCAGAAVDRRFCEACEVVQPQCPYPTFGLAMHVFERPHWSVVSRLRPLRYWRLVDLAPGPLLQSPLSIDERILQYLLGVPATDERLDHIVHPLAADGFLDDPPRPELEELADRGATHWTTPSSARRRLLLTGGRFAERAELFRAMCERAGYHPWALDANDLPESPADRDRLARVVARETALWPAALLVRTGRLQDVPSLESWLDGLDAPLAMEVEAGTSAERLDGIRLAVPGLTAPQRKSIWRSRLGDAAPEVDPELDAIVEAFPLDAREIGETADALREMASAGPSGSPLGSSAWRLCRQTARRSLDDLATRVDGAAAWDDLVLPPAQAAVLRQIVAHARRSAVVHGRWGFDGRHAGGTGLSALFSGPSGTGKTMAAGVLARQLDRDLYQIDLATVTSKYIGETEKHLRRIFDIAERSGAVLLFDEADALFGKRSQVRDSHDRYANLEVSYLLQRMESYRGIAILTTNMQNALDPAFQRRLRFVVQFPFPDPPSRERIWRKAFPSLAPTSALDPVRLAQLNVTGGVIRNVALLSAFLAADDGESIEMRHVLEAARTEYAKLDKPLTAAETRGWE